MAHREEDGKWKIIATGIAGREPVNLLASPDGTLHIIGWPNGIGTMWSGKPHEGQITMKKEAISGVSYGDYPFNSAGIDSRGNICVLSSSGGEIPGGLFRWACFLPASKNWIFHSTLLDYRFCYTYVFPNSDGSLSLISTRDVRWSALKYEKPDFINYDYVYNAFGYWYTDNLSKGTLNRVYQIEEKPTEIFNYPELNATLDAYLDSNNEMHVIYRIKGASTNGVTLLREAVLAKDGTLIKDIQLPEDIGMNPRIFQDTKGNFFILGSSGKLYPAGRDGVTLTDPYQLNLGGYNVEWSGFGISVPRTGSMVSDTIHVVYPSGNGTKWIYFEFNLPEQ